jgi:hypothetical protein
VVIQIDRANEGRKPISCQAARRSTRLTSRPTLSSASGPTNSSIDSGSSPISGRSPMPKARSTVRASPMPESTGTW